MKPELRISRRTALSQASAVAIGIDMATRLGIAADEPTPKVRILLIATKRDHPWASHMYQQDCALLARCLNQTPGIDAVVCPTQDWPADPALLRDVKSIVFYSRSAGDIILAPQRRETVRKLLSSGVGYTALHWGTGCDDLKLGAEYEKILGGWFNFDHSKLDVGNAQLVQVAPDHPICHGWKSYEIHDEFYLRTKFDPKAIPVLKVNVKGNDEVVGWVLERTDSNGGRSFGFTLGHFHENFGIEAFRRAIVNGILWTAHVDVPADGAPVRATEEDLKLPPKD